MHGTNPTQESLRQTHALMCFAEGIKPAGMGVDLSANQVLEALAIPGGFADMIARTGEIRIELAPDNHQHSAETIMTTLDLLDGQVELFEITIKEDAAFLRPTDS